jgi:hypothetical protein
MRVGPTTRLLLMSSNTKHSTSNVNIYYKVSRTIRKGTTMQLLHHQICIRNAQYINMYLNIKQDSTMN